MTFDSIIFALYSGMKNKRSKALRFVNSYKAFRRLELRNVLQQLNQYNGPEFKK